MWSKFAEVQCAFAVAEVQKVTASLSQTCGFAIAEHLLQFCGICGCGIKYKFAVPSSDNLGLQLFRMLMQLNILHKLLITINFNSAVPSTLVNQM